ncbi:MAG: hypothetical protein JWM11_3910 [Planctomycetaceae bacterium]|nr:hypothetical protein [Planctomycetaceae bacterium]
MDWLRSSGPEKKDIAALCLMIHWSFFGRRLSDLRVWCSWLRSGTVLSFDNREDVPRLCPGAPGDSAIKRSLGTPSISEKCLICFELDLRSERLSFRGADSTRARVRGSPCLRSATRSSQTRDPNRVDLKQWHGFRIFGVHGNATLPPNELAFARFPPTTGIILTALSARFTNPRCAAKATARHSLTAMERCYPIPFSDSGEGYFFRKALIKYLPSETNNRPTHK